MVKNSSKSSYDNWKMMNKISKKYFSEIEQYVPHLQQTLFDFQNEYYKIWKNTINSNISLYDKFNTQLGFNFILPESSKKLLEDIHDKIIQHRSLYHKILIKSIESGKENTKVWTEHVKLLDEQNAKILQFWSSVFTKK